MTRPNRLAVLAYAIAAAVIVLDQALKYWVLNVFRLPERVSAPVIGPFWLSMVWNRGVSFGFLNIGAEWTRWVLAAFAIAVAVTLALWVRRVDRLILAIAVGLIMGGAVGNVIDRVRFGAVTDFLDFSRLWFPWVFNVADSGVSIGSLLLVWDLFLAPRKAAPA
jgi:signal peptidase II